MRRFLASSKWNGNGLSFRTQQCLSKCPLSPHSPQSTLGAGQLRMVWPRESQLKQNPGCCCPPMAEKAARSPSGA
eukprot:2467229-Prymnesium_polylepis.1